MINLMQLPASEAERLAYSEGFTGTAELFARLSEAEHAAQNAEDTIARLREALEELVAEADAPVGWDGHTNPNTYGFQLARAALEALK